MDGTTIMVGDGVIIVLVGDGDTLQYTPMDGEAQLLVAITVGVTLITMDGVTVGVTITAT
jgi:hypothetical protein